MTISGTLIEHVRLVLEWSLRYALTGHGVRHGDNAYTPHALPAYIASVAAVEALVNETLLGPMIRVSLPGSPLWNLKTDTLQKMELTTKLVLVPQVLFGNSFRPDAQPLQDFQLLQKVRNDMVHYKMQLEAPRYLQPLTDRRIALTAATAEEPADYPWVARLSSTEGVRWAHNSACEIVQQLVLFVPENHRQIVALPFLAQNFQPIPETYIAERVRQLEERKNTNVPEV